VINTCIKPKLRYGFYVAPYAKNQLQKFDAMLSRAYKQAYGLRPYASTAMAMEDVNKGGLGSTSVTVEYTVTQVDRLTKTLNDEGLLGQLTRASLQATQGWMDKCTAAQHPTMMRYSLRLRQLAQAAAANIEVWKEGESTHRLDVRSRMLMDLDKLQGMAAQDEHRTLPVMMRDIALLQQLGVKRVADILGEHAQTVLSPQQLTLKYDTAMTQAQRTALARITQWLTSGPEAVATSQAYTAEKGLVQAWCRQGHRRCTTK
jgi:hypothetical protein